MRVDQTVPDVRRLAGGGPVPADPELQVTEDLWLAVDLGQLPPQVVASAHQAPGHLQDVLRVRVSLPTEVGS